MKKSGRSKALYITDESVWEQAEVLATIKEISLSKLVQEALEFYLERQNSDLRLKMFIALKELK